MSGKQSLSLLSFVYTSCIRYGFQATPKFGKHALLFSYYKEQKYIYAICIICSVTGINLGGAMGKIAPDFSKWPLDLESMCPFYNVKR